MPRHGIEETFQPNSYEKSTKVLLDLNRKVDKKFVVSLKSRRRRRAESRRRSETEAEARHDILKVLLDEVRNSMKKLSLIDS
ncbi:hypothetical protein, partial [Serratia marcescens]|uniref:hypothetical protein n=1 Tax=Serratia marcescens TaxID=615 RepID=UPI002812E8FC